MQRGSDGVDAKSRQTRNWMVRKQKRNMISCKIKWLTHVFPRGDLSSLPFTTMCIKESLRLHSPVQAVTRKYTQNMPLPGDRAVPKGERHTMTRIVLVEVLFSLDWVQKEFKFWYSFLFRCYLFGQYLWNTPQPRCLVKPSCKKIKEKIIFLYLFHLSCVNRLFFRSLIPSVLTQQTQMHDPHLPSFPFQQGPGTVPSSLHFIIY